MKINAPWYVVSLVYLALAIAGLYLTWSMNFQAFEQGRDYFGDWVNSGPAVTSLVYDVVVAASAATLFMVIESVRLRAWWLLFFLPLTLLAVAFSFPLFLAARELCLYRQVTKQAPHE